MNKLYTGLLAIVVGIGGCDSRATSYSTEREYQIEQELKVCHAEKKELKQSLEQKLRLQLAAASQELAKAKADAKISCDGRVKEAIATYMPKPVEIAEGVTPQFPKSNLPMHEIVRGLAAGKYNDTATDLMDESQQMPFLYRGFAGNEWYDVALKEQCPQEKSKNMVDLPAEHTACELGAGVAYNFERGEFEVSLWKEYSIEDTEQKGSYNEVREVLTFRGVGQGLEWSEVTEVDIRTPATQYGLITMKVSAIEPELVHMYQKKLTEIPPKVLKSADAELKRVHTSAM